MQLAKRIKLWQAVNQKRKAKDKNEELKEKKKKAEAGAYKR